MSDEPDDIKALKRTQERRKYQSLDREKRAGIRQVSQMRRAESESARRRKSAEEIRGPWEENAPSELPARRDRRPIDRAEHGGAPRARTRRSP